jgi:hypothetical protein
MLLQKKPRLEHIDNIAMLIITGTGRSGTGTMAKLFGGHHEFRVRYILDKYFLDTIPRSDPFDTIEKRITVMLDLHQGIDRETFVDSSNLYIYFIDALYLLDPKIKIILAVRNGKDFVRSALSRKWHEQNAFSTVPLRNDLYYDQWDSMTPLQKNAWIWDYRNRKAVEGLRGVPEKQKLVLKIEEVKKKETLDMLESFTGKGIYDRAFAAMRHNANSGFSLPPKEEWTESQENEFNAVAGGMMRFFGYD